MLPFSETLFPQNFENITYWGMCISYGSVLFMTSLPSFLGDMLISRASILDGMCRTDTVSAIHSDSSSDLGVVRESLEQLLEVKSVSILVRFLATSLCAPLYPITGVKDWEADNLRPEIRGIL